MFSYDFYFLYEIFLLKPRVEQPLSSLIEATNDSTV